MSIKPPSDIVMDVARAAEPAARSAATRRLAALSADGADGAFATALGTANAARTPFPERAPVSTAPARTTAPRTIADATAALETLFLRSAFETMLPNVSHARGFAGAGAGVWKSTLADALANQVAASGGLRLLPTTRETA